MANIRKVQQPQETSEVLLDLHKSSETVEVKEFAKTRQQIAEERIALQRERDAKPVRGIFRNFETPGGILRFSAKAFPKDKVKKYELMDGMQYTLPTGIARHLARNCWYPVHAHAKDADGNPCMNIGKKVYRFGFQSLEFMGDDSYERPMIQESLHTPLISL